MAYDFFPTSVTEIIKKLKATTDQQKTKVAEISKVFTYLSTNKKVVSLAPKFLIIDSQKYANIKIPRVLKGTIDPQKIMMDTKVKNIKVEYGDGSSGGRGVNNKGGKFEKEFAPAIRKLYESSKSAVAADFKTSYDELLNITPLGSFDVGSLIVDGDAGASNTKRPIQYSPTGIELLSTSPNYDIGKMLTDITLSGTVSGRKKEIYLSLKTTTTVTFFNAGITTALPKEEIKKGNIVNKNGLALLKMLRIDPGAFCDSYNHPTGWSGWSEQVDLNNASHKAKLQKFLESGIGHGYTVIHQLRPGNVKVFNVTEKYMKSAATPESMTVYYGGKTGTGKRVDVVIETPKYTLGLNIRDTQGKDGYPGRIMCNFWYK
jgi:hypothetical protein